MRALLFGLFVGYFLAACAPLHWNSAHLVYGVCVLSFGFIALIWSLVSLKSTGQRNFRAAVRGAALATMGAAGAASVLGAAVIRSPMADAQHVQCSSMVEPLLLRLAVLGTPAHTKHGSRINTRVLDVEQGDCSRLRDTHLRLTLRGAPWVSGGQVLLASVRLRRVRSSMSPGAPDYELAAARRGQLFSGYVIQILTVRDDMSTGWFGLPSFQLMRAVVRHRVLSAQLDHGGMILALATGDSVGLSRAHWRLLQNTGTVHLLIISGLHVGLVASVALLVIRLVLGAGTALLGLQGAHPRALASIEAMLTSVVLFGYVQLVGAGVPAVRAWLMVSVALFLWSFERKPQAVLLLLCAFLGVVITQPMSGFDAGFWLSFALVGWLLLGRSQLVLSRFGGADEEQSFYKRFKHQASLALSMHVQCCLLLLPLMIWLGLPVAPIGVVANLLAVPFVTLLLVPLIVLSVVMLAVSDTTSGLGFWAADCLLGALVVFLECLAGWAPAEVLPLLSFAGLLSLVLVVVGAVLPARPSVRWACRLGVLCWMGFPDNVASLSRLGANAAIDSGEFRVSFLDVGQGLGVLVHTAEGVVVYDTGAAFPSGFSFADTVVAPALRAAGATRIRSMVISHSDNDHAGGAELLLAEFDPQRLAGAVDVMTGALSRDADLCSWRAVRDERVSRVSGGANKKWQLGGVEFELVNRPGSSGGGSLENDDSCVLIVRGQSAVVVLAGDIEAAAERALTARLPQGVDVLSIPHHGSRTSSTPAFVERLHPGTAVVSAGYLNRFGHPHPRVIERYVAVGAMVLSTAKLGTIEWSSTDVGGAVGWRAQQRGRWRLGAPMMRTLQGIKNKESSQRRLERIEAAGAHAP